MKYFLILPFILILWLFHLYYRWKTLKQLLEKVQQKFRELDLLFLERWNRIPGFVRILRTVMPEERVKIEELLLLHNHIYDRLQDDEKIKVNERITIVLHGILSKINLQEINLTSNAYQDGKENIMEIETKIASVSREYNSFVLQYQKKKQTFWGRFLSRIANLEDPCLFLVEIEDNG